jgi:hypothetical protein
MKRITALALFAASSLLGAGMASAQTHGVKATMPFDFTVGGKVLPPGTYKIVPVTDAVIEIQNNSNGQVAVLSQTSPNSSRAENGGKLVFDKYGDQYFLREVLGGASALNVSLPASKSEKYVRNREVTVNNQTHASATEPTQVFVATTQSN